MKRKIFISAAYALLIDQIVKYIVSYNNLNVWIIRRFLGFIYTKNTGIAFSLFSGNRLFIITFSIILIAILIGIIKHDYLDKKIDNKLLNIAYGILLGGILGNLIDRIVRGYVVDFVSLKIFKYYFPIFNLADICITIGIVIILIDIVKLKDKSS